jgi:hypothetical protein
MGEKWLRILPKVATSTSLSSQIIGHGNRNTELKERMMFSVSFTGISQKAAE